MQGPLKLALWKFYSPFIPRSYSLLLAPTNFDFGCSLKKKEYQPLSRPECRLSISFETNWNYMISLPKGILHGPSHKCTWVLYHTGNHCTLQFAAVYQIRKPRWRFLRNPGHLRRLVGHPPTWCNFRCYFEAFRPPRQMYLPCPYPKVQSKLLGRKTSEEGIWRKLFSKKVFSSFLVKLPPTSSHDFLALSHAIVSSTKSWMHFR